MKSFRSDSFVFHTTGLNPCPYLPEQSERKIVTDLNQADPNRYHDLLSRSGFRRSHRIAYAPACPNCSACTPVRIRVADFKKSSSFQRILKRNSDLSMTPCAAKATGEQHKLFMEYQEFRHTGGDMATMSFLDYQAMVEDTPIETFIYEYRTPDEILVAAILVDVMADGLSAVYSFFKTDEPKRSLGTFVVLSLVDVCETLDLPYVYLGYWIANCQKMSYKTRFKPLEAFKGDGWADLDD